MALFGKKKKKKFRIMAGGVEVFRKPLIEIPIPETVIIEKSIEFFDDADPCYIHRGAVVTRLAGEIQDLTEAKGGKISGAEIPEEFHSYLDLKDIESIEVIEE